MPHLDVCAKDAHDIYRWACKAVAKTERALQTDPSRQPELERLKRLRDQADALQNGCKNGQR